MIELFDIAAVQDVVKHLRVFDARKATKYLSPKFTVKVTRSHRVDRRSRAETVTLTYGVPNFEERKFIKAALKAKEPFPIRRVQLKFFPLKKRK